LRAFRFNGPEPIKHINCNRRHRAERREHEHDDAIGIRGSTVEGLLLRIQGADRDKELSSCFEQPEPGRLE